MGQALLDILAGLVQYSDYWFTMACFGVVGFVIKLIGRRYSR